MGTVATDQGRDSADSRCESLIMVETCIDDMNPEIYGFLMERLFAEGALDVYWIPIQMKKNRPGTLVRVLCPPEKQTAVTACILSETTSLGVRTHTVQRVSLAREAVTVQTPYGVVARKKGDPRRRRLSYCS